jgi:hypothetical protein
MLKKNTKLCFTIDTSGKASLNKRRLKMKTRQISLITFLTLILIVFTLVVATGENGYTPKENEEFYGIWINPEYNDRTFMAKLLCKLV